MTGTAYPGDAVAGVPTYTATMGRTALAAAMGGASAARPLGGISGVRPGTSTTIATATSTTWTVTPFGGYIDLESPATTGGYFFSFQANETGAVTAAAVSARVDLLYVQINDSNTGDGSGLSPRATLGYQAGVAGAGIPALSAARAFVIAQINVPASGGGSPTVTWVAPNTVAAGGVIPSSTYAYLDTTIPATAGQLATVYADGNPTVNNGLYRSNGSQWVKAVPQITTFGYTGAGLANGNLIANVTVSQKSYAQTAIIQLVGAITASGSTTAGISCGPTAGGTITFATTTLPNVDTTQKRDGLLAVVAIAAGSGTVTLALSAAISSGTCAVSGVGTLTVI